MGADTTLVEGAYKTATKSGKKEFTHKGKKYTTRLKGEEPKKKMFELSGKTSKKIKRVLHSHGGLIKGFPKIAKKGWS